MTNEISISLLLKVLKSAWWKILIFTVVIALIAAAVTSFVIPKKYSSSVTFYVNNTSSDYEYTTASLLEAAQLLANGYIEIIKSDVMLEKINTELCAKGYQNITPAKIKSMISAQTAKDVPTFTVSVTSESAELSHDIAVSIEKNAPDVIKNITRPSYKANLYMFIDTNNNDKVDDRDELTPLTEDDLECIKSIRHPVLPTKHTSPDLVGNTVISAIIAAIIAYVFFLVLKLFDTTIRGEESIKALVNIPVIGKIPQWDLNSKSPYATNRAKEYRK